MSPARTRYRILDEPEPSTLAKLAVSPTWPLLALMLAGAWLALPWFAFNGIALGSPSRRRELALAAAGLAGAAALGVGLLLLVGAGLLPGRALPYLLLVPIAWKLGIGYAIYSLQGETFQLYEHFGGKAANGMFVLLVGAFVVRGAVLKLFSNPLWLLIAS
jgi:hypothetical protein